MLDTFGRAEAFACIGMREPNAGARLARVRTCASNTSNALQRRGGAVTSTAHAVHGRKLCPQP